MSIFGKIFSKIFGPAVPVPPPTDAAAPTAATPMQPTSNTVASVAASERVDVEVKLEAMAAANAQKLNWRTSIVDLMKLVGMESSLAERRELADELGFTGDKQDTATMNIWLHKQVLRKMSENGGTVPASLLD